jgi:hypothetical protein
MDLHSPVRIVALVLPAALLCLAVFAARDAGAATRTLLVEAGKQPRAQVPMCVDVPDGTAAARMSEGGKDVPCQIADGKLWWILDELPADGTKTYTVELGAAPAAAAAGAAGSGGVELKQGPEAVDIAIDGKPFTTYVFVPKPSDKHILHRPYFFPVYGPGQLTMTRQFPLVTKNLPKNATTDHPHHTSIWMAYGEVSGVDNWSIAPEAGWQIHKAFQAAAGGPVVGVIRHTLDWTDVNKKPNLAETRTIRVFRLPDDGRMLDVELAFQAKYGPVVFADTKEGGLIATRMREEFQGDKKGASGRLVNSEGQAGEAAWGKKALWVDASGMVDGKRYGYAIFDGAENLRHPQTWHARTYGLLSVNPFGLSSFDKKAAKGDWTLEDGKTQTFRYRIYFHPGDEKDAKVAQRCGDYTDPPKATWK